MNYSFLWLLFLCVSPASAFESNLSKTLLAQETCSNSGSYTSNNITLEWDDVNSSSSTSYCALTVNPYNDERFIRFVFKESPFFLRYFFSTRMLFSTRKESFFRKKRELFFTEIIGGKINPTKVYAETNGVYVSGEKFRDFLGRELHNDFLEFVEFVHNTKTFISMFEKYPILFSSDGIKTNIFFMPRSRELAVFAGSQKEKKDVTIYFSPRGQNDFLFWKISFIRGRLIVIEYSSSENLFWVDESGDGFPEFCLKKQQKNWLRFPCIKQLAPDDGYESSNESRENFPESVFFK